jgi:hypothetical protein
MIKNYKYFINENKTSRIIWRELVLNNYYENGVYVINKIYNKKNNKLLYLLVNKNAKNIREVTESFAGIDYINSNVEDCFKTNNLEAAINIANNIWDGSTFNSYRVINIENNEIIYQTPSNIKDIDKEIRKVKFKMLNKE